MRVNIGSMLLTLVYVSTLRLSPYGASAESISPQAPLQATAITPPLVEAFRMPGDAERARITRLAPVPRAERVSATIEVQKDAYKAGLTEETLQRLLRVASFEDVREAILFGRSFVVRLPPEGVLHRRGRVYRDVVLKAVTYHGGPPQLLPFEREAGDRYVHATWSLQRDPDGRFFHRPDGARVRGGAFLWSMRAEQARMNEALDHGIPTGWVFGLGEFPELRFEGKPLGFLAIAVDDHRPRMARWLDDKLSKAAAGLTLFRSAPAAHDLGALWMDIGRCAGTAARILRQMHHTGFIHGSAHLDQFAVLDAQGNTAVYDMNRTKPFYLLPRDEFILRAFMDFKLLYKNVLHLQRRFDALAQTHGWTIRVFFATSPAPLTTFVKTFFDVDRLAPQARHHTLEAASVRSMNDLMLQFGPASLLNGVRLEDFHHPLMDLFIEIYGHRYNTLTHERASPRLSQASA
jgi:hypothetical protein